MFLKCPERSEVRFSNSYSFKFPVLELNKSLKMSSFNAIRSLGNLSSGSYPRDMTDQCFQDSKLQKAWDVSLSFPALKTPKYPHDSFFKTMFYQNLKKKPEDLHHTHPCLCSYTNLPYSVLNKLFAFFLPRRVFPSAILWGAAVGLVPAAGRSPILLTHTSVCDSACFSLVL